MISSCAVFWSVLITTHLNLIQVPNLIVLSFVHLEQSPIGSSSVQMASAYHVGAAVLAHVARRGQLDSALDERSFSFSEVKTDLANGR